MKKCIYVVDDQAPVLEAAVMTLKLIDGDWEVIGFDKPAAALEAVKSRAPDLIISDQVMPEIQGSQLLEQVRAIAPGTIRVIMSGFVALNRLTLITSAHQYIAKPFDATKLRELILRSFAAQDRVIDASLQKIITSLKSIPSLPQVHHSLMGELEDERAAMGTIAEMVAEDPGLSVKVLQLANSPLFGKGQLVNNPAGRRHDVGHRNDRRRRPFPEHFPPLRNPEEFRNRPAAHLDALLGNGLLRAVHLPRETAAAPDRRGGVSGWAAA